MACIATSQGRDSAHHLQQLRALHIRELFTSGQPLKFQAIFAGLVAPEPDARGAPGAQIMYSRIHIPGNPTPCLRPAILPVSCTTSRPVLGEDAGHRRWTLQILLLSSKPSQRRPIHHHSSNKKLAEGCKAVGGQTSHICCSGRPTCSRIKSLHQRSYTDQKTSRPGCPCEAVCECPTLCNCSGTTWRHLYQPACEQTHLPERTTTLQLSFSST